MANRNEYLRYGVYNGEEYAMDAGDTPETFLRDSLAPAFPDLRGATWTETHDDVNQITRFTYSKVTGQKGLLA